MPTTENPTWPVVKHYDQEHLAKIALPLGGIGTGTVALGGRGDLRDWEIMNRPAKGFTPTIKNRQGGPFFALWAKPSHGAAVTRAIEGPVEAAEYEGAFGAVAPNHGLPRFRHCSFSAAYPFGQVLLDDPEVPAEVRIEAFNPLIPGDAERSGLPVAILRFVLTNRLAESLSVSVAGSLPNFIGVDGSSDAPGAKGNENEFRSGQGIQGIFMSSGGVASSTQQWGTLALATTARAGVSFRTAWLPSRWGTGLLDFWDDFSADGRLDERDGAGQDMPQGSVAVSLTLPPHASAPVTFLLAWHFPNRYTWTPKNDQASGDCGCGCESCADPNCVGNYYATRFRDAWEAAAKTAGQLADLEKDTLLFVRSFCESDLPPVVKEAALFNLTGLRSQTSFRIADGHFLGWEGCGDEKGCCHGSCTHVWNYEQATPFLFGDLSRSLREIEFLHATDDSGLMSFRVDLPLSHARDWGKAAADGQMGCLMKMYRDWQLSGDDAMLKSLWPRVKKALEFCWMPGGWDADRDGVMEGCQHNTMDVEYYGPNAQMGTWYLGALRAVEEMARYVGEQDFAATCRDLFERGSAWLDANLFNGEYYEHQVRPPQRLEDVAPSLRLEMGATDVSDPDFQLGPGCLVDQLVGQYMAHICGLGYLVKPENVQKTLSSILRYNLRRDLSTHFNCLRSFVVGDETALLMASYPKERPVNPFPYFTEVMTGFEYTAAVGMLYEGQIEDGLRCMQYVRDRYDGCKRSPFDEAECGHHYARAMASWAAVPALTGFHYSAVEESMSFAAKEGRHFWSNGSAWGVCEIRQSNASREATLRVLHGSVVLQRFALAGNGEVTFAPQTIGAGQEATWVI